MSWINVRPITAAPPVGTGITFSVRPGAGRDEVEALLTFREERCAGVEWVWREGINVELGEGDSAGQIRITAGGLYGVAPNGPGCWMLGLSWSGYPRRGPTTACLFGFFHERKELLIELPEWVTGAAPPVLVAAAEHRLSRAGWQA